MKLTETELTSS